jgi:hypothetical protein
VVVTQHCSGVWFPILQRGTRPRVNILQILQGIQRAWSIAQYHPFQPQLFGVVSHRSTHQWKCCVGHNIAVFMDLQEHEARGIFHTMNREELTLRNTTLSNVLKCKAQRLVTISIDGTGCATHSSIALALTRATECTRSERHVLVTEVSANVGGGCFAELVGLIDP